jgi:hypothetical protein
MSAPGLPITVEVAIGEHGKPYTENSIGEVTVLVHESLIDRGVLNVEVDGDLDQRRLRLHVNDQLIFDSQESGGVAGLRRLVSAVAAMTADGRVFVLENDDAVDAVNHLIGQARELLTKNR